MLPEGRLADRLTDGELNGAVRNAVVQFENWLADNRLVFFSEYTDHGPVHVKSVLRGAEALIADSSWEILTPRDVAVLVLAVVLHDCAMHVGPEGFLRILGSDWRQEVGNERFLDLVRDHPWAELWESFLVEASRFDQARLQSIFGSVVPPRRPPRDPEDWTERDRRLIGEFLRRHHARLAHEIALAGVPGPRSAARLRFEGFERDFLDLVGFVARSHNLDLRDCVDLLPRADRHEWRDVHVPFVMAVLRIADFLEVQADRAPHALLAIRRLRSPVSQLEWAKHAAIPRLKIDRDDPETRRVEIREGLVQGVETFLGLRNLFAAIQVELDLAWSTLGEVYGRIEEKADLALTIRRIRSDLDDTERFARSVPFVPTDARLRVADGDILKLLVGPLYGDEPGYGVRELVQNAVDACRELEDYIERHPGAEVARAALENGADVLFFLESKEDDTVHFRCEDRGIGMTAEVVEKYFLTAGASYRYSAAWRAYHEDSDGKSRVARSGRFGVGVLAAFLLTDEVEVETRHASDQRGLRFRCGPTGGTIELQYCDRPVGTRVSGKLRSESVLWGLLSEAGVIIPGEPRWLGPCDWFVYDHPRVVRGFRLDIDLADDGQRYPAGHEHWIAGNNSIRAEGLPHLWPVIESNVFSRVRWGWDPLGRRCRLACNGLRVRPIGQLRGPEILLSHSQQALDEIGQWDILSPTLLVTDLEGALPLDLLRTRWTGEEFDFDEQLCEQVYADIVAWLLVTTEEDRTAVADRICGAGRSANGDASWHWAHPAMNWTGTAGLHWLALVADGLTLSADLPYSAPTVSGVLASTDHERLDAARLARLMELLPEGCAISSCLARDRADLRKAVYGEPPGSGDSVVSGVTTRTRAYLDPGRQRVSFRDSEKLPFANVGRGSVTWAGEEPRRDLNVEALASLDCGSFTYVGFEPGSASEDSRTGLGRRWQRWIGDRPMPLDRATRKRECADAYRILAEPIDRWRYRLESRAE